MSVLQSKLKKRGDTYYLHYFQNGRRIRRSLDTTSRQVALEKQRQFDSARARGEDTSLPTKTPLADAVEAYIVHMTATRTRRAVTADLSYLRGVFGEITPGLESGARPSAKKGRLGRRAPFITARSLEDITTYQVAQYLRDRAKMDGIGPKTANRTREVLSRLVTWSMKQNGVRMPGGKNPVEPVDAYRVPAPEIRFLRKEEIIVQLHALRDNVRLQTAVAILLYAGLRREELTWLRREDVVLGGDGIDRIRVCAKTVNNVFWEPKTKVNRVVPISPTLRTFLERYERSGFAGEPWYLPNGAGKRWDADCFSHQLRTRNERAGLPWSSLDFRHTFGSHLAMKGESLYKIAKLMGNSPDICRRHYASLTPESLVDSVEFMNGVGEPQLPTIPRTLYVVGDGR